jgi:hypothetical protein
MIGNDTPTRPNQIPLPTTSPEFQDAHLHTCSKAGAAPSTKSGSSTSRPSGSGRRASGSRTARSTSAPTMITSPPNSGRSSGSWRRGAKSRSSRRTRCASQACRLPRADALAYVFVPVDAPAVSPTRARASPAISGRRPGRDTFGGEPYSGEPPRPAVYPVATRDRGARRRARRHRNRPVLHRRGGAPACRAADVGAGPVPVGSSGPGDLGGWRRDGAGAGGARAAADEEP